MIRIYCDTNVFSNLETYRKGELDDPKKIETYASLKMLMDNNKSSWSYFFSHAHIRDKEKADERKFAYFDFIESYVGSNCIHYFEDSQRPLFFNQPPKAIYDDTDRSFSDLMSLFVSESDEDGDGLNLLRESMKDLLVNQIIKIPDNINNQIPEKYQSSVHQLLPIENASTNVYEVMQRINTFTENVMGDQKLYKDVRSYLFESLHNGSLTNVPSERFEELFELSIFKKTFYQYVIDSLSQYKDKTQVPYHYFYIQAYILMDMFGISKEKLKRKNTFNNILNDSFHSYYAQYCDIFITEDEGMRKKSGYLYDLYGTSKTKIMSPIVAVRYLPFLIRNEIKNFNDFVGRINQDLNEGEKKDIGLIYEHGTVSFIHCKSKYFNYFNGMLLYESDAKSHVSLVKINDTVLHKSNDYELGMIVNKCISIFGQDGFGVGNFNPDVELVEIQEGVWKGRGWKINEQQTMWLMINQSLKQLSFDLGPIE